MINHKKKRLLLGGADEIFGGGYEDPPIFGQLITIKQDWGIRNEQISFQATGLGESMNAVDADKWCQRWAVVEMGAEILPDFCNLHMAEKHQGYAPAHRCKTSLVLVHWKILQRLLGKKRKKHWRHQQNRSTVWKIYVFMLSDYFKHWFKEVQWCFF